MYWQEDELTAEIAVPDDIIDVQFAVTGQRIPVDHGYTLGRAIANLLPVSLMQGIGVHIIHVAGSQNGWQRPAHSPHEYLALSRRTKLTIRLPKERAEEVTQTLRGRILDVGGCPLAIGDAKHRCLSKETTLFARYIVDAREQGETELSQWATDALQEIGVRARKMLCGKSTPLWTPDGPILTRSLLLASLSLDDAILLQQWGLGPGREMGCGLFIPHKGVEAVQNPAR